ncbi:MAG: lipoyl(octanoyl) transferase LipB [Bdellovibrionota bacterium]
MSDVRFLDWGQVEYSKALDQQKELLKLRQEDKIIDTFIFCEHPAVITVGRGKPKEGELPFLPPAHIPVVNVERGGLATYHGPGQLVCYPIVRLAPQGQTQFPGGIVQFIRFLEDWMIRVLKEFDVNAWHIEKKTGVWVGDKESPKKIASIGIAVSHWVTYHGLAFNFATGPAAWRSFNPCGLSGELMTDLKELTNKAPSYEELRALFVSRFNS